ncbi:MAG: type VI secretion system tip protein TssI/VgrG [Chitinivibrionales bacterium]|nr:type VI secretion system tip protein TssI/VgrG [Chitinivibrionales bacterium]
MPPQKANAAHFYFFCAGLPKETFEVAHFNGSDEINTPYRFSITLLSARDDIAADDVINKRATLLLYRNGEYFPYSGIVNEFQFVDKNVNQAIYAVTILPALNVLHYSTQTRIFQKMKVTEIIRAVLDEAGLGNYYSLKVDAGKYAQLEYVVQYRESDLNFITRLMENSGIWYFFNQNSLLPEELDHDIDGEALVITDKSSSFEALSSESTILYRAHSGMVSQVEENLKEAVHRLQQVRRIIPQEVIVKDYNYRTPEVDLTGRKKIKNGQSGTVFLYGGHSKNVTEAQAQAEREANRIAITQTVFEGEGNCRGFRAAKQFTLNEHFRTDCNGSYCITKITHEGAHVSSAERGTTDTYTNTFWALPAAAAQLYTPPLTAHIPRVNGIMSAFIEAQGSSYAGIDEQGRYKVRMPFDRSSAKNYEASRFMRLAQPYSGANYGMHFPSHEGVEMVYACVDGNPDRPLGIGTVPSANTVSPVVGANKQHNIIRTAGGGELLFDDTDGKQKARITTKAKNILEMSDELKKISLQTTAANQVLLDDKNEMVSWNGKDQSITMTYKSGSEGIVIKTGKGHSVQLDDKNKRITIQTSGGNIVQMDDDKKAITLTDGKNKVTLDANGKILLDSQGEISITAVKDITIKGANIKLTANSAIEATATADLKLKGMNIEAKADMNAKVNAGMNLELKGGMQTKLDGMMTEVNGGTMTKVKGAIVMIN